MTPVFHALRHCTSRLATCLVALAMTACLPAATSGTTAYGDGKGDKSSFTDDGNKTVTLRTLAWSFDVSTYPVSITTCTHQGLGSRLIVRDQIQVTYKREQRDGRIVITEVSRKPIAGTQTTVLNKWWNHGRTVNYADGCQDPVTEVVITETLKTSIANADEDVVQRPIAPDSISDCIKAMPDGPCDDSGASCNYCLPDESGLSSCTVNYDNQGGTDNHNGHNSNNDAQALRRLWNACTSFDAASRGVPSIDDLCVSPDNSNMAACHSVINDSESIHQQNKQCSDDPSLYGSPTTSQCTGKQPYCGPTAQIVCGLG